MSSILESAARSIKNHLPGVGVGEEAAKQQLARGGDLIKRLSLGGLALGGGTGAAVVLANYLKSLGQEADVNDNNRLNDDTLYIPMGEHKKAASMSDTLKRWTAPGLAVTGGVLGAGAAYALTQAVYNYAQKKHRQAMLDDAQNQTLQLAEQEASKSASASMTFTDLVSAVPVAVPLLAALASGGIAYAALNKTFPVVREPQSKFPKRIRAISDTGEVEKLPTALAKAAADREGEADCTAAAYEYLSLFTDRVAMEKHAAICVTSDILNRVAKDGIDDLQQAYAQHGLPALCEIVKGASDEPASVVDKAVAAVLIFKSARLAPVAASVAASEFLDLMPGVAGMCSTMDADRLDKMAGLGTLLHLNITRPVIFEKCAHIDPALLQDLMASLRLHQNGGQPLQQPAPGGGTGEAHDNEERDAAMTSDLSGSMAEDNEGGDMQDMTDDNESQAKGDQVDQFMTDPKSVLPAHSN